MNHSPKPENAPAIVAHALTDTLTSITQQPQRIPPDLPLTTPPPKINPNDTLSVVVIVLAFALFALVAIISAAALLIAAKS